MSVYLSRDGADEHELRTEKVRDGAVIVTNRAIYYGTVEFTLFSAPDKKVMRIPWDQVAFVGMSRQADQSAIAPWAKAFRIMVKRTGGAGEVGILCRSESQATEFGQFIYNEWEERKRERRGY